MPFYSVRLHCSFHCLIDPYYGILCVHAVEWNPMSMCSWMGFHEYVQLNGIPCVCAIEWNPMCTYSWTEFHVYIHSWMESHVCVQLSGIPCVHAVERNPMCTCILYCHYISHHVAEGTSLVPVRDNDACSRVRHCHGEELSSSLGGRVLWWCSVLLVI